MAKYIYKGEEAVLIRLAKDTDKKKVSPGEIVESDLPKLHFTANGFESIEVEVAGKQDGNESIEVEVKTAKKSK